MLVTKFKDLLIRDSKIFNNCSEKFVQDILSVSEKVKYFPGEMIRDAGSANNHVFVVVKGQVNIVDGKDTVLHKNDVVGIYSHMNGLGFCVYTSYASQKGAICIRVSKKLLNFFFKTYPRDKEIIISNTLRYVNRRPREHILSAMKMQVSVGINQCKNGSKTNLYHNTSSDYKKQTTSMKKSSTPENQKDRKEIHVRPNVVRMAEHAEGIAQINSEKSQSLAQETIQKTRRHSDTIGGTELLYSNSNSQEKSKSATEYVRIFQNYDLKFRQKSKIFNFRCMCLSCWVMFALYFTWFSNV